MSDDKKEERMNVLRSRHYEDENEEEDSIEENEANDKNEVNDENDKDDGPSPVRDRAARTMYAGKDVIEKIDIKYEELSPRYRREKGEKLSKNDVFYPALLRAGLYGTTIEAELRLETDSE